MENKIVKTDVVYLLLGIFAPLALIAIGIGITYFFFYDGGTGAVIFSMCPPAIAFIWYVFGLSTVFKKQYKKFEAELDANGFKRNQTFYGRGKFVTIDLEKGEIGLLFFWNPFKSYVVPASRVQNAWVDDGKTGSGIMQGSSRVSFIFIVDSIKIRVDTFTSNQRQRMDSDYILTGISKADLMVNMLAQARETSFTK